MPHLQLYDAIRSQGYAVDRSILHNDAVYYLHGDTAIGKLWPVIPLK